MNLDSGFTCKRKCSKHEQTDFSSDVERLWFARFVADSQWQEAKTYAKTTPHQYCVKDKMQLQEEQNCFEDVVRLIRENGYDAPFFHTTFRYFNFEGYSYFTCDGAVAEQGVINRVLLKTDQLPLNTGEDN